MPYIIENIIKFDEVKGCLINVDTNDETSLPPSAVCILSILLNQEHRPVERGELIEQVYVRFGYDMANNTLNQYISLLRKNIRELGVEAEVIITIPKVGFYISSELMIKVESFALPSTNAPTPLFSLQWSKIMITVGILVSFVFTGGIMVAFLSGKEVLGSYDLVRVGKVGNCDLYFSVNLKEVNLPESETLASKMANKYLPCKAGSVFIYDIDAIHFAKGYGRSYLARCTGLPGENKYAVCSEVSLSEK